MLVRIANREVPDETASSDAEGAQWLSGRVPDLGPRGFGFERHQHHCVVSLSKTH